MRRYKNLLRIGVLVLFFLSLAGCMFISSKVKSSSASNLFIISKKQEFNYFTREEMERLEKKNYFFTFMQRQNIEISNGIRGKSMEVVGTNDNFPYFLKGSMLGGTFFNKIYLEKKCKVAVINEKAAFELFGTTSGLGNRIYIGQQVYEVIGVIENSYLKNTAQIYLPETTFNEYHSDSTRITDIWCQLSNISESIVVGKILGYGADDIKIIQMEQYKDVVTQRFKIILFSMGIVFISFFVKRLVIHAKSIGATMGNFHSRYYISDIKILKNKSMILESFAGILDVIMIGGIFKIISFRVVIPPIEFLENGAGLLRIINNIIMFYFQPDIGVNELGYLNEYNTFSTLFFFSSCILALVFCDLNEKCKKTNSFGSRKIGEI